MNPAYSRRTLLKAAPLGLYCAANLLAQNATDATKPQVSPATNTSDASKPVTEPIRGARQDLEPGLGIRSSRTQQSPQSKRAACPGSQADLRVVGLGKDVDGGRIGNRLWRRASQHGQPRKSPAISSPREPASIAFSAPRCSASARSCWRSWRRIRQLPLRRDRMATPCCITLPSAATSSLPTH